MAYSSVSLVMTPGHRDLKYIGYIATSEFAVSSGICTDMSGVIICRREKK